MGCNVHVPLGAVSTFINQGDTMPRKTQADMIAQLEEKLAAAKANQIEKDKAQVAKLYERRDALTVREQKIAQQILDVDEQIADLVTDGIDSPTLSSTNVDEV